MQRQTGAFLLTKNSVQDLQPCFSMIRLPRISEQILYFHVSINCCPFFLCFCEGVDFDAGEQQPVTVKHSRNGRI